MLTMSAQVVTFLFGLAIALPTLLILFFIIKLALHSRRIKQRPSAQGLIGLQGRAESAIANDGLIFVRGELWRARSAVKIQRGQKVFVKGVQGLALDVEPVVCDG